MCSCHIDGNCHSILNISSYFIYITKRELAIRENIPISRHLWVEGGFTFLAVLESLDEPNFRFCWQIILLALSNINPIVIPIFPLTLESWKNAFSFSAALKWPYKDPPNIFMRLSQSVWRRQCKWHTRKRLGCSTSSSLQGETRTWNCTPASSLAKASLPCTQCRNIFYN